MSKLLFCTSIESFSRRHVILVCKANIFDFQAHSYSSAIVAVILYSFDVVALLIYLLMASHLDPCSFPHVD